MQGSCRCQIWQATTRHLAVKKIPRSLKYLKLGLNKSGPDQAVQKDGLST